MHMETVRGLVKHWSSAAAVAGLLAMGDGSPELEASAEAPPADFSREFSAMPHPCEVEPTPTYLQQTADQLATFWQSEGLTDFGVDVVYVPEIPAGGCQVELDGKVNTISGSQNIRETDGVAITPGPKNRPPVELRLILRHETGHKVQEVQGVSAEDREASEATADCDAGMSSQNLNGTEVQTYRTTLHGDGATSPGDPHGTAYQRQAYFDEGYDTGKCPPEELSQIRQQAAG
jgi:hypothetical protein